MEPGIIPKLLLVSLYLLISITSSKSHISPTASPGPQPDPSQRHPKPELSPSASPGPQPNIQSKSGNSPTASPGPQPISSHKPSPGPQVGSSYKRLFHSVSLPPTSSDAPSEAPVSPNTHVTSSNDGLSMFQDLHTTSSHGGPHIFENANTKIFNPQVKKICDSTDYPTLCMTTVIPVLKDQPNLDSILYASIRAGNEFAKNALSLAKALGNKPNTPPSLSSILKDCKDSYDTAVENYEKSINAFSEKDIGTIETMLSAVITDVSDCQEEFDGEETDSPFSSFAEKLTNMTSNCLAIVSLMKS